MASSWLKFSTWSGTTSGQVQVSGEVHTGNVSRNGHFTITNNNGKSQQVTVQQQGALPIWQFQKTSVESSGNDMINVKVITNLNTSASSMGNSGIQLTFTGNSSDKFDEIAYLYSLLGSINVISSGKLSLNMENIADAEYMGNNVWNLGFKDCSSNWGDLSSSDTNHGAESQFELDLYFDLNAIPWTYDCTMKVNMYNVSGRVGNDLVISLSKGDLLVVTPTSLTLTAAGTAQTINIESNSSWQIT